uniref:Nucleoporin NUP42 n=1 Tax=Octopus bimaculoides TaxID=37653 RepID=A0A0L8FR24_OCTBM
MAVCKYFLQGNCRYGNKCWFDHTRGGSGNNNSQRQLNFDNYESREARGNVFQSNNRQQQNKFKWVAPHLSTGPEPAPQLQQQSPQEIISTLSREITNWEASKMWLLSCISFGKSGPSIPGMVDMSPDELRCEAYNALKSERFQDYPSSGVLGKFRTWVLIPKVFFDAIIIIIIIIIQVTAWNRTRNLGVSSLCS